MTRIVAIQPVHAVLCIVRAFGVCCLFGGRICGVVFFVKNELVGYASTHVSHFKTHTR